MYDRLADLPVTVDGVDLERHERETSSGFDRSTTEVVMTGAGETGRGEDVTYETEEHVALEERPPDFGLEGEHTFGGLSARLGEADLFPWTTPDREVFRNYRRWGFESAALDLALRQADTDLGSVLDRDLDPVHFVVSTRLGEPPRFDRIEALLGAYPDLELKLDPTTEWTPELIDRLVGTGRVRILDLKGQYEGTEVDQTPDPDLYRHLVEAFPEAVLEDPKVTGRTRPVLEGALDRLSWDAPITSLESVEALPWAPRWLNVKPSRFGSVERLLECVGAGLEAGITLYGGGQFELSVGRGQLQVLASLFYPESPNDVAPGGYNDPELPADLPSSPLRPAGPPEGFRWPG